MNKKIVWSLVLILLLILPMGRVHADTEPVFLDAYADVKFGEAVDFNLSLGDPQQIQTLYLFIQPESGNLAYYEVPVGATDLTQYQLDPRSVPLRAFSDVVFWYQADLVTGEQVNSEEYRFTYLDNRFEWQALQTDHIRLYWYEGDLTFATNAINIAEQSYQTLQSRYGDMFAGSVIDVFVYGSTAELQDTLTQSAFDWVAGHADPELGQVLLSIAPGAEQRIEMERQLPHELTHLFLYRFNGGQVESQPAWLMEGLASNLEKTPNPDYRQVLANAVSEQRLIPVSTLCKTFPTGGEEVYLAYAESASFVAYLEETHGNDKLRALLQEYAAGTGCEQGFLNVYEITLGQMEGRWHQSVLGINRVTALLQKSAPYVLLLAVLVIPAFLAGWINLRARRQQEMNAK